MPIKASRIPPESIHPMSQEVDEVRFSLLEQRVGGIENSINTLTARIETWMTSRSANPWKIAGIFAAILIPIGWMLNIYITQAISPWAAVANQAKAAADTNTIAVTHLVEDTGNLKSQAADSARNRQDLSNGQAEAFKTLNKLVEAMAREQSTRRSKNAEIETQFRAFENYSNLTRVWENRMIGMLWQKVYDQPYPVFQFYPTISRPANESEGDGLQ